MITAAKSTSGCVAALTGLVAAAVPSPAQAHQQWLSPNFTYQSGSSAWLSFDHTFGDRRFLASSGPGSYYSWWIVTPNGVKRNVPHLFVGKTRTVGEIELTDSGTYRLEAVEDRMAWSQIKVDGEETWQPGTRKAFGDVEVVRSTVYFNKSVSYITLNKTSNPVRFSAGDPLEIRFEDHPNDLYAGEAFAVRVLAEGEALPNQPVRLFDERSEGHDATSVCTTNADGLCVFEIATAGRYLLTTSASGDHPAGAATDGYSHGYTVFIRLNPAGPASGD